MKIKDIRNKSDKELQKDLADSRAKLLQLSIDYRTKEVKNVREIRSVKRTIARILTVMTERASAKQGEQS
jgi:large subunit ribosomal protein L29